MAWPIGYIYYATAVASADVTDGQEQNETLDGTEPASATVGGTLGGSQTGTQHTFTAVDNDPNLTSWEAGDYIAQVNVETLGADITWGIEIHRVDSAGTSLETLASVAQTTYNTASVQTLTWNNASAKTVNAGDRLQIRVTGVRAVNHGNQALDIAVGTGVDSTTTKLNLPPPPAGDNVYPFKANVSAMI